MNHHDDALLRALVLHVATGAPLSEEQRALVTSRAVQLGAPLPVAGPPLELDAYDEGGARIDCNAEGELSLTQIGMTMWLSCYIIRLSGDVDRKRRRVARDFVEYFESRRAGLGLDDERPILFQYLKHVPHVRASERSAFLGGVWLPAHFLLVEPDFEAMPLDRLFATHRERLTLYKICYWFAAASGRRQAAVIDALGRIRTELQLDSDPLCPRVAAIVTVSTGSTPPALRDPDRSQPLAAALAALVVAGSADGGGTDEEQSDHTDAAQRLIELIPKADRIPALAHVFDVAVRVTHLSAPALGCIARIVDAIDPSEGELTGILLRHELDSGKRIRLPRSYTIDYAKPELKYRRPRM